MTEEYLGNLDLAWKWHTQLLKAGHGRQRGGPESAQRGGQIWRHVDWTRRGCWCCNLFDCSAVIDAFLHVAEFVGMKTMASKAKLWTLDHCLKSL